MADVLCPKCNATGAVKVKQSKKDKGADWKYYECSKCRSVWTNSADISKLPVEA
jgi:Zn-finger nucleic acid-binding protein